MDFTLRIQSNTQMHATLKIFCIFVSMLIWGCDFNLNNSASTIIDAEVIRITEGQSSKSFPSWSPDNKVIVFAVDYDSTELISYNLQSGEWEAFMKLDFPMEAFALSPDAALLAYQPDTSKALMLYDIQNDMHRWLSAGPLRRIAWSRDGNRIAYCSNSRLAVFDLGSNMLTESDSMDIDAHVAWSPDHNSVVYARRISDASDPNERYQLWIWELPDSHRPLTPTSISSRAAHWSPNNTISFLGDTTLANTPARDQVWFINPDGSNLRLFLDVHAETSPRWSPNGEQIAVEVNDLVRLYAANGTLLYVTAATGTPQWHPTRMTLYNRKAARRETVEQAILRDSLRIRIANSRMTSRASWYPRGDTFIFSANDELFKLRLSGDAKLVSIGHGSSPAISPDGQWIAYHLGYSLVIAAMNDHGIDEGGLLLSDAYQNPSWSPESDAIVVKNAQKGGLTIISIKDGRPTDYLDIFPQRSFDYPAWSPNHPDLGSLLAFQSNDHIYTCSPNGDDLNLLVRNAKHPSWSPDASRVTYIKNNQIYAAKAFGDFARTER